MLQSRHLHAHHTPCRSAHNVQMTTWMQEQDVTLTLWGQEYKGNVMSTCTPKTIIDTKWGLCTFSTAYKSRCDT